MDLPPILYKYRTWDLNESNKHDHKILTDRQLYFTFPHLFNDPFDCKIEFDYGSMSNSEIANNLRLRHSADEVDSLWQKLEKNRAALLEEIEWRRQKLVEDTGVLSMSVDPNHLLLWSHYADGHAGFCVGLDSLYLCQIEDDLKNHPKNIILDHLQVKYRRELPKLNPFSDDREWFMQQYRFKSDVWTYEQEYRFVMIGFSELAESDRIISLSPEAVREVILGCDVKRDHENEIRQALEPLRRDNPTIKLLRTVRSRNCFELEVELA